MGALMHDLSVSAMIVGIALSWVVGLTPPLLIRYVWLKAPLGNWPAAGLCLLLWIINFGWSSVLGGAGRAYGALSLVAFASYWILRKDRSPRSSAARGSGNMEPSSAHDGAAAKKAGAAANAEPASDEQFFAMALEELEAGRAARGLWAKCFAEAEGDESKARARYLSARSARLNAESAQQRRKDDDAWRFAQASLEECLAFLSVAAYNVERTDAGYRIQSANGLGSPIVLKDLPEVRMFVENRVAGVA